jgi:predicted nucleic acid-binding protein
MTLWVIDTDSLSLLERGNPKIQERLRQTNIESVAISIVTAEEKMKGRLALSSELESWLDNARSCPYATAWYWLLFGEPRY